MLNDFHFPPNPKFSSISSIFPLFSPCKSLLIVQPKCDLLWKVFPLPHLDGCPSVLPLSHSTLHIFLTQHSFYSVLIVQVAASPTKMWAPHEQNLCLTDLCICKAWHMNKFLFQNPDCTSDWTPFSLTHPLSLNVQPFLMIPLVYQYRMFVFKTPSWPFILRLALNPEHVACLPKDH